MNLLSVEKLTKSFGEHILFTDISFGLLQGDRIALVGINGSGKSTLLKLITGKEKPDSGNISIRKDIRIGYLDQDPIFVPGTTVGNAILHSDNRLFTLVREYEEILLHQEDSKAYQEKLQTIMDDMDRLQAWDFDARLKQILGKLGIHDLEQMVDSLSGGQRKRVALAALLVDEPDLLILDEPTNHLDLEAIEWLEELLNSQNKSLLMITHDRYFLDKATNAIYEIDHQKLLIYKGNYAYYLEKKAEQELIMATEADRAKNLMRKELEWMRRQPKARGTKSKSRIEAFYTLQEKAKGAGKKEEMTLEYKTERLGSKILEMHRISKSFGDNKLFDPFSYVFKKNDRIGIVGRNGAGKSTLIQMMLGNLPPDTGKIVEGETVKFGYFSQDGLQFDPNQKIIDLVKDIAENVTLDNGSSITISQFLNMFLFPPAKQHTYISRLSGGEKRRLHLLTVLIRKPNFLILDEPTNDLDIQTMNVLEDFLTAFGGCLVVVSHDRYFLDRMVDHLFVLEGDYSIKDFPGNYTDYREYKAELALIAAADLKNPQVKKEPTVSTPTQQAFISPATSKNKLSFKERKELDELSTEIPKITEQIAKLSELLMSGETDYQKINDWGKQIEILKEKLDQGEFRWLELSEKA